MLIGRGVSSFSAPLVLLHLCSLMTGAPAAGQGSLSRETCGKPSTRHGPGHSLSDSRTRTKLLDSSALDGGNVRVDGQKVSKCQPVAV